jgi:hypothetical protein
MSKWSAALEDDIKATKKQDKETSGSAALYREELDSLRGALSGSGEPPADVKHTMDVEEADLREKLRRAWGPDYANTSVAIQELSELGKKRALAYAKSNTETVQALEDAVTASRDSTRDFKLEKKKFQLAKKQYLLDARSEEDRAAADTPSANPSVRVTGESGESQRDRSDRESAERAAEQYDREAFYPDDSQGSGAKSSEEQGYGKSDLPPAVTFKNDQDSIDYYKKYYNVG